MPLVVHRLYWGSLFSDVENNQYERGQAVKKSQSALQLQKGTQLK